MLLVGTAAHAADMAAPPADPVLADLIRESLAARPELRVAEAQAQAARARVPQAEALPDPTLSLGIQNDGFKRIAIGVMDTSFFSIGLSQELPWPGKRALRGQVASLAAGQTKADIVRARLSTEADVRRAYLDLLLARDRLALLDKLADLWQRSQELAKSRYEVASGPQSDILRAQLERGRLAQRRLALEAEEHERQQALNRLRAHPLDEPIATPLGLRDLDEPLVSSAAEEVADAEARSPELAGARLGTRRSEKEVKLAEKEQYPDFAVNAVPDAAVPDARLPDAPIATLTLSLDPALDGDTDVVKATSITAADLLDTSGAAAAHATITTGQAVFDLSGVAAGDFFIKVNGDADDLVPTHIDNPTASVTQRVGQKLRASMIGPQANPVYRINTYSAGQAESSVVKYSDATPIAGEQPYVFITLTLPTVDIKVLGTAATLSTSSPKSALHPGNSVPFDAWILNTTGQDHHGDAFNGDPTSCTGCHTNMLTKPATYAAITTTNGWCFRCHSGSDGPDSGFFDSTK